MSNHLPNALNKDTISLRFSLNFCRSESLKFFGWFCGISISMSNLPEYRIFSAVPSPWTYRQIHSLLQNPQKKKKKTHQSLKLFTWSFPQSRHLSHPTQSMIFDILRNFSRKSAFRCAAEVPLNITLSLKCDGNDLKKTMKLEMNCTSFDNDNNNDNEFIRTHSMIFKISLTAVCTVSSSSSFPVKYGSVRKNGAALASARSSSK